MKENYQLLLDRELELIAASGKTPKLLLHSCCGPCSSYVLEYLSKYFEITIFYYNPNIYPMSEYFRRAANQKLIIERMPFPHSVDLIVPDYTPEDFTKAAAGLENEPEGGARCLECFKMRLDKTVQMASGGGFDYFTTTLSVSPHKNAQAINEIGKEIAYKYCIKYLFSDFKKRDGYKRSIELSEKHDIYRQDYCGCEFSMEKN